MNTLTNANPLRSFRVVMPECGLIPSDGISRERLFEPRRDVLREQDIATVAYLLLEGYACRHKLLADGRRQITAIVVPGDICNPEAVTRGRNAYGVQALSSCVLNEIAVDHLSYSGKGNSHLHNILWRQMVRDQAISHEWLVGLGRRTARERIAHLFCELWYRLDAIGLVQQDSYVFPLTQGETADVLGLSTVHVNRVLQELRRADLVHWSRGRLTILDRLALEAVAGFDPTYLDVA